MGYLNHKFLRFFRILTLVIGALLFMFATWQYMEGNVPFLVLAAVTLFVLYNAIENGSALRTSAGLKIRSKAEALSSSLRSTVSVFYSWIWKMFNGIVILFSGYMLMIHSASDLPWDVSVHGMWVMAMVLFVFTSHVVIAVVNMQQTWLMSKTDEQFREMKTRMQVSREKTSPESL